MKNQMTFQRYEFKYLMDYRQLKAVLTAMDPHMVPDEYTELPAYSPQSGETHLQRKTPCAQLRSGWRTRSGVYGTKKEVPLGGV